MTKELLNPTKDSDPALGCEEALVAQVASLVAPEYRQTFDIEETETNSSGQVHAFPEKDERALAHYFVQPHEQDLEGKLAAVDKRASKVITFNVCFALSMVAMMALAVSLPFA